MKNTNKPATEETIVNLLAMDIPDSVNSVVEDLAQSKEDLDGGPITLFHNMPEAMRNALPKPGTKASDGVNNADIRLVKVKGKDGKETEKPRSFFRTFAWRTSEGVETREGLDKLKGKGKTVDQIAHKRRLNGRIGYITSLFRTVASIVHQMDAVSNVKGVTVHWIKDANGVIGGKVAMKLCPDDRSESEKPISTSQFLALKPELVTPELIEQHKGSVLEALYSTRTDKAGNEERKGIQVKTMAEFSDALAAITNYTDDASKLTALRKMKYSSETEETLRSINDMIAFAAWASDKMKDELAKVPDVEEEAEETKAA